MPPIPKSVLKAYFEKGDKPTQSQFYSLIDSSLNLVDDQRYLGLKIYSVTLPYEAGDITVHDGIFYEAIATTSGVFDPSKWAELSTSGSAIISITYSALTTLKASGILSPGQIYFISDKGIWVDALSTSQLNLSASYLAANPDFQNETGNCLGIWNAALTGITAGVSFVIWNNLHWLNITGDVGEFPDSDTVNWAVVPKPDPSYRLEIDDIKYDFDIDFIFERSDKRGNFVGTINDLDGDLGTAPMDSFQWGRDGVNGNFVKDALLHNMNAEVMNFGIQATNLARILIRGQSNCSYAIFSTCLVLLIIDSDLQNTVIRGIGMRTTTQGIINRDKRVEPGFSNFEETVDITGLMSIDVLTIAYAGIYHLTSSNGPETLTLFSSGPTNHPFELRPAPGVELTIIPGSDNPGDFSLPSGMGTLLLIGNKRDYAKFRVDENGVVRYMESVTYG